MCWVREQRISYLDLEVQFLVQAGKWQCKTERSSRDNTSSPASSAGEEGDPLRSNGGGEGRRAFTYTPASIPFCEEQNGPLSSPAEEAGEDGFHIPKKWSRQRVGRCRLREARRLGGMGTPAGPGYCLKVAAPKPRLTRHQAFSAGQPNASGFLLIGA